MDTMQVELTLDQENAKNFIVEWFLHTDDQVFVLSGYAGTGKTFLINHVIKDVLYLDVGAEAVFVTPTGKAATVLAQSGTVAGTVHSLIYIRNEDEFDVDENGEIIEQGTHAELLALGAKYSDMWHKQADTYMDAEEGSI